MIRVLLISLAVISLFCGYLWLRVDHLAVANNQLNDDVAQYKLVEQGNKDAISKLEQSIIQRDALLVKQHQENQSLNARLQSKRRKLSELSKKDETVKDWAVEPVPDAISQLFNPAKDSSKK